MDPARFAQTQLELRLAALNRACSAAVARQQREAAQLDRPDLAAQSITDRQVTVLLERVGRLGAGSPGEPAMADLDAEDRLRAQGRAAGLALPLDTLSAGAGLTEVDRQALVAVAAPELDRAYERIYAYLCDEFDRRHPSVELLMLLTQGLEERPRQRLALGPYGSLRGQRLLVEHGDAPSDLRQQLRLGRGVLEFLLGAPVDLRSIAHDAAGAVPEPSSEIDCAPWTVAELAAALRDGLAEVVAVWGRPEDAEAAVAGIAATLEARVHRLPGEAARDPERVDGALREAAIAAGVSGGLLWLPVEPVDDPAPGLLDATARALATTGAPVLLSATTPWRPVDVLARRRWIEVRAGPAGLVRRAAAWRARHPALTEDEASDLASRFRLSPAAAAAASGLARTAAALGRPRGTASAGQLETACAAVSTPRPDRLVSVTDPRWGPADLVLPSALHRQVVEIAAFARSLPKLADAAGGGPLSGSQRGLKVLFTGDPGTGKTLASEVIARLIGVQLVKVDLSRVVSKWVGETAKHLDAVFNLVEGTSAVLFFDEADALFGKRAEVRHGTDRYANTEVSHLLQRFEEHAGLIVLASNLRDQIDPAFTRRFHTVLHFPRPEEPERHRLWELVLPGRNGAANRVDLGALATLDLTGAGIVGSARTAALLAAAEGSDGLSMAHLAHAVARQFRSEGRLAPPEDLAALANNGHSRGANERR